MRVTAPPEAPEGERTARLEAAVEHLIREVSDLKADGRDMRAEMRDMRAEMRDIRSAMNRFMFAMIAMWVTIIITILLRT